MTFSGFNLSPRVAAGVDTLGYQQPTPIQQGAIPPIMAGRDVMGLAQTGTGKTAAFALPILQRLETGPRGRVRALIVAPTRELAEQIRQAFTDLGRQTACAASPSTAASASGHRCRRCAAAPRSWWPAPAGSSITFARAP